MRQVITTDKEITGIEAFRRAAKVVEAGMVITCTFEVIPELFQLKIPAIMTNTISSLYVLEGSAVSLLSDGTFCTRGTKRVPIAHCRFPTKEEYERYLSIATV